MENINSINVSDQKAPLSPQLNKLTNLVKEIYLIKDQTSATSQVKTKDKTATTDKNTSSLDSVKMAEINLYTQAIGLASNALKEFKASPINTINSVSHDMDSAITISDTLNNMLTKDDKELQSKLMGQLDSDITFKKDLQKFFKTSIPSDKQYKLNLQVSDFLTMKDNDPMYKVLLHNFDQYKGLTKLVLADKKAFDSTQKMLSDISLNFVVENKAHDLSMLLHKNYADILAKSGNNGKALHEYNEYLDIKNTPVTADITIDPQALGISKLPKQLDL